MQDSLNAVLNMIVVVDKSKHIVLSNIIMNFDINYFLEKALNWNQKNNIENSQDDIDELKIKLIGLNIIKYLIQNTDE